MEMTKVDFVREIFVDRVFTFMEVFLIILFAMLMASFHVDVWLLLLLSVLWGLFVGSFQILMDGLLGRGGQGD